jgi:PAS domain S-box-containing protein
MVFAAGLIMISAVQGIQSRQLDHVLAIAMVLAACSLWTRGLGLERRASVLSEQKARAQFALHEAEAINLTVNTHSIVSVAADDGRIISANDEFCAISGYSREELIGQDHRILNSGHHPKGFWLQLWKTLGRGQPWRGDICNRAKDGSLYWVDSTIAPIKGPDGRIEKYVSVRRDITERVRAEAELIKAREIAENASRAKDAFLANISHEIRTPMAAILGHADLMLDPSLTRAGYQHGLQSIRRNGEHLLNLINEILDLSKIEAGKMKVERIPVELPRIAFEAISTARPRALVKNLTLSLEFTTPIPSVGMTDPLRLRQILVNLIGNAIKFTESGGVVLRVSCLGPSDTDAVMRFEVIDTGIGLAQEEQSQLFQSFSQADPSTTRRFGGTGLGLAISRQLARLLGGDISVQSAAGTGSSFTVEVGVGPVTEAAMTLASSEACPVEDKNMLTAISPDVLRGVYILLAEDGLDNREIISAYLHSAGADVTMVDNGREAVDAVSDALHENRPFSIVLMDMQMPILDGYGATSELRRHGYTGPIVALTAHAMSDDRAKCLNSGCTDYLSKPVQRHSLVSLVAHHVNRGDLHMNPSQHAADDMHAPDSADAAPCGAIFHSPLADDPVFAEVLGEFVSRLPEKTRLIAQLSAAADATQLKRVVHQLKGAAGSYGFAELSAAAARVQHLVQSGQPATAMPGEIEGLIGLIRRVEGYDMQKEMQLLPSRREAA